MKRGVVFFMVGLFLISSCLAQEIDFAREFYSPSETILGQINNVLTELHPSDLKVYEGRREVFFEKGLLKFNDTYYFYIIPTKEGEFNLKISNVLYNNSGTISSISFEKKFSIINKNDSVGYGVRPGVFEGQNPEFVLTNLKNEPVNISMQEGPVFGLAAFASKKISVSTNSEFSLYKIGEYEIPIIAYRNIVEENKTDEEINYNNCFFMYFGEVIVVETGIEKNYSLEIINNCPSDLDSLTIISDKEGVGFFSDELNISGGETFLLPFYVLVDDSGELPFNLTIFHESFTSNLEIRVFSFSNLTNLETFTNSQMTEAQTCSELGGEICAGAEVCSTEEISWDYSQDKPCCIKGCIDPNYRATSWVNIVGAIFGISVIIAIGYYLFRRSKRYIAPKAEERFKEAEKKYERKFVEKK